jgi:ion channel
VWTSIVVGCVLMVLSTFIHAGGMVLALRALRIAGMQWAAQTPWTRASTISVMVLIMFIVTIVEASIWGLTYVALGAMSDLNQALYFSTVTFTTLGYGDIVLEQQWRLLSSFEAANGTMMFGWTTALIAATVHRVYFPPTTDGKPCGDEQLDSCSQA